MIVSIFKIKCRLYNFFTIFLINLIKISILEILSTIVFNEKKDLFEHYVKDYNIKIRKVCFITLLDIKPSRKFLEEIVRTEKNIALKSYMNERLY